MNADIEKIQDTSGKPILKWPDRISAGTGAKIYQWTYDQPDGVEKMNALQKFGLHVVTVLGNVSLISVKLKIYELLKNLKIYQHHLNQIWAINFNIQYMEEENIQLKALWNLFDCNSYSEDDVIIKSDKERIKIKIIKEITKDNKDHYVYVPKLKFHLEKFCLIEGISPQMYYDYIILKIKDVSNRPKCSVCKERYTEFVTFVIGYRLTCSKDCLLVVRRGIMDKNHKLLASRPVSEETRRKLSLARIGRKPSPKTIKGGC